MARWVESGPLVWSSGRRRGTNVPNRDPASMVGHDDMSAGSWYSMDQVMLSQEDLDSWDSSPGILVKFSTFLGALHWPEGGRD